MYTLEPNIDYRDQSLRQHTELSTHEIKEDTAKHYDDCYRDYLLAWCNKENLALHYGYWDKNTTSHHQALLNKNQILYDTVGIKPTDKVLDAGCGIGGSSIWMARHHQNKVTGITVSAKQVSYARKHAKRHGVADLVEFEVSDYCQTPFEDESFDIIWGLESVCYAVNKGDFLAEAYRLLRKGGRIVVCDGFMFRNKFNKDEWQAIMTCFNGWAVPNLCSASEFRQSLEQNQFKNIASLDLTAETLPSSAHMYKISKRLQPIQKLSQWLGLRSKAQTANFEVGLAQYKLFHEQLVDYHIFTAEK